MTLTGALAAT